MALHHAPNSRGIGGNPKEDANCGYAHFLAYVGPGLIEQGAHVVF